MGKKSPAREPDYTRQKASFASSEAASRQKQADAYNGLVNQYNSGVSDLSSQLSSLGDSFKNLTIVDDEKFGSSLNQLTELERQYNALQANLGSATSKPVFNSVVQSAYGPVEVAIPNLVDQNTTLSNGFSSQLSQLRSMISNLQDERRAEEARIDSFSSNLNSQLASLGSSIGSYGIADLAGINTAKSRIAELNSGLQGFQSAILGEYKPNAIGSYSDQLSSLSSQLDDLLGRRTAEQNRISSYEQSLNDMYDQLSGRFSGLTIADLDAMNQLQREIDAQQLGASRFQSQLSYDFNDELNPYNQLETQLARLMSEREAELSRVRNAEQAARSGMSNILSQLGNADIYNAGTLNQIGLALDQGQNDINSFSSVLGGDFSMILPQMDQARSQLQQLQQARQQALSNYGTNADTLLNRLNGYDLANESGIRSALNEAQQLSAQLSQFTGTDVAQYRDLINNAVSAGNTRLSDLSTERGNIENAARSLLTQARSSEYTSTSALDELAKQLAGISDRQTNYNATQALDEIDALAALISGERSRLSAEEAESLARQRKEAEDYASYAGLGNGFSGFSSYLPSMSPWLSGTSRYRPGDLPSSFARQLNVVYA